MSQAVAKAVGLLENAAAVDLVRSADGSSGCERDGWRESEVQVFINPASVSRLVNRSTRSQYS